MGILIATHRLVWRFSLRPEFSTGIHSNISSEVLSYFSCYITIIVASPEVPTLIGSGLGDLFLLLYIGCFSIDSDYVPGVLCYLKLSMVSRSDSPIYVVNSFNAIPSTASPYIWYISSKKVPLVKTYKYMFLYLKCFSHPLCQIPKYRPTTFSGTSYLISICVKWHHLWAY